MSTNRDDVKSTPNGHRGGTVYLKQGRAKPVRQGHPWVFSGALQPVPPPGTSGMEDGDIVDVADGSGTWLARGYLNRKSQITVRILTWRQDEAIDAAFWRRHLRSAIDARAGIADAGHTAYRLVHGESDFLPGLIVDRIGDFLVLQSGTLGIDRQKGLLAGLLQEITGCRGVIERSDMAIRKQEGLTEAQGVLAGEAPPASVTVEEYGLRFAVDMTGGQKTGFYTDQRENRRRVAAYCRGRRVLDAFSYTGGFGLHALAAGAAHVLNLDSSVAALERAEQNLAQNGFDPESISTQLAGDAFQVLRDWRDSDATEGRFDVIILDPPKFAHNKRSVDRALRGYKDINLLAMKLLAPNGILATFSCSGLVQPALFQKVIFGAAVDAGRRVQVLERLHQAPDHPVAVTFPEGDYLKGFICRVL